MILVIEIMCLILSLLCFGTTIEARYRTFDKVLCSLLCVLFITLAIICEVKFR